MLSEFSFEATFEGKVYTQLRERDLETVLPSSSQLVSQKRTDVVVVRGQCKGMKGQVLSIDKKRDVVQVQIEYVKVDKFSQDDVCCFV